MELSFDSDADELVLALTHGPTPGIQEWEVIESYSDGEGEAWAVVEVNGKRFDVTVKEVE